MRLPTHAGPLVAGLALATALAGLAACDAGGDGTALPSTAPSLDRTVSREAPAPTRTREGQATTEPAEPTRTAAEPAEPTPTEPTSAAPATTKPAEPDRTTDAPATTAPARTTNPPEPTTAPPATADATTGPAATGPATTGPATTGPAATGAASPAATPSEVAATTTGGVSALGWVLILLLLGLPILVGVLLVNRRRRAAAWSTEAAAAADAGRGLIATRLPLVLSTRDAAERALAWPPVRAGLTETAARWSALATSAPDDYHRAAAGQIGVMAQDLVTAVDAENQALATGRDWRRLSPQVDQIVQTLDAALTAFVAPEPGPGADTGAGPDPYPA
ncbi:hypothetical protein ACFQS1_33260 [Paractinoplanes rhizophilus]|uniref:Uncharacterized protein n=1 Tax=Paractinoplanes rhizophilus TaxID=1416877 RepID=A0ABW2I226_9ACTN